MEVFWSKYTNEQCDNLIYGMSQAQEIGLPRFYKLTYFWFTLFGKRRRELEFWLELDAKLADIKNITRQIKASNEIRHIYESSNFYKLNVNKCLNHYEITVRKFSIKTPFSGINACDDNKKYLFFVNELDPDKLVSDERINFKVLDDRLRSAIYNLSSFLSCKPGFHQYNKNFVEKMKQTDDCLLNSRFRRESYKYFNDCTHII